MQEEMDSIKEPQGKNTSEVHQDNLHLSWTKVYFLVIAIIVQNFGIWQGIVEDTTRTNIMVPIISLEATSFMNKVECFNCHTIVYIPCDCNLTWVPKQANHDYQVIK